MFDPQKLKENAVTSIRLGIEDFQTSQKKASEGGDPDRALSAVRNLFAGVLLLFKYRIASSVDEPEDQSSLIFNPPEVLPGPDGKGGVIWAPNGKYKKTTIDFATIKKRLDTFEISVDWIAIEKMQEERNRLEHLHTTHAVGVTAGFVADLFPVLRDFIAGHLGETPTVLLGEAWAIMLAHHKFFDVTLADCRTAWAAAEVPERMNGALLIAKCPDCGSPLIRPADDMNDEGETVNNPEHMFVCMACDFRDMTVPLLEEMLVEVLGGYSPYDGDFPPTETCPECLHETFVVTEAECFWCNAGLEYNACARCEVGLCLDDQENGGLCGYCKNLYDKVMKE
jgi:hypothetical protein